MAGIEFDGSVLNLNGVPMVFALPLANFPAAGVPFRIGFRTDAPYGIYLDNGTSFVLIAANSSGGTITGSGTAGTVPIFSAAQILADSIITQLAGVLSVGGRLQVNSSGITASFNRTVEGGAYFDLKILDVQKGAIEWHINDAGSAGGTALNIRNNEGALGLYDSTNTGMKILSGNTVVGSFANYNNSGLTPKLNIVSTAASDEVTALNRFFNDARGPIFVFGKSRGTVGVYTYPNASDFLGRIFFSGANTFNERFDVSADISAQAVSNWSASNAESSLLFFVCANGTTTRSNVFTLKSNGTPNFLILAGTGTRMVVADNLGNLSTQAIPGGGGGSVTGLSVVSANGFSGVSDGAAVVPALTLSTTVTGVLKGNGSAISAAVAGTDYVIPSGSITGSSGDSALLAGSAKNAAAVINTIVLRDANADIFCRTVFIDNTYGNYAPNHIVGTSATGQIREMSKAQAKTYLDLAGTNTGDQINITGNAGTATVLQTARTISGTSFDGSANITLNNTGITNGAGYITNADLVPYAPLASPGLTGNPTAPTQAPGDNTTKIATTAFVAAADALKADLASPGLTGNPTAPTQTPGDNSTKIATTAFVTAADALKAPLASPGLTGNPTAPTQAPGDNSTKIATTAFVTAAGAAALASGSYTPVLTLGTNVSALVAYESFYNRVGSIVTVYGRAFVNFNLAINSNFVVSLPIASNLGVSSKLVGVGSMDQNGGFVSINGAIPDNAAQISFVASAPISGGFIYYSFQYQVI